MCVGLVRSLYQISISSDGVDSVAESQDQISAIPGAPGRDYPAYTSVPRTSFTCEGLSPGFYSDPEGECQVYHHCTHTAAKPSFTRLCPIGSILRVRSGRNVWTVCRNSLQPAVLHLRLVVQCRLQHGRGLLQSQ